MLMTQRTMPPRRRIGVVPARYGPGLVGGAEIVIAGIGQRNIKRLMAYSSIGHMGYALIGLAAGGAAALLIWLKDRR